MKKNIIIINTFPNTEIKQKLLTEQVNNLNKLGYPILLISGCEIPKHITDIVDFYFINKVTNIIGKDFTYKLFESELNPATSWFDIGDKKIFCYSSHCHSTIAQNIVVGFEIAKSLGFTTALYAEDDNIFNEGSFDLINNSLNKINKNESKMCGIQWNKNYIYDIVYTTFFITDITFLLEIFKIPTNKDDWYDMEIAKKYKLYKTFEGSFNDFLMPHIDDFHNISEEVFSLQKEGQLQTNTITRYQNENFLIDVFMTILLSSENVKTMFLINKTNYLPSGQKLYNIKIYYDDNFEYDVALQCDGHYYVNHIPDYVKEVKLSIDGYGEKTLSTDIDIIKYNGKIV
jgi:uncharacterized membrane protein